MSFETELLAALGDTADVNDIRATVRKCFHYDFVTAPMRLWDGQGKLHAGGEDWVGTMTAEGVNIHQRPALRDPRDGSSPRYEFSLPYVDEETWLRLKANKSEAEGRELIVYNVIVKKGEGLRPGTALRFSHRLLMKAVKFTQGYDGAPGQEVLNRRATAVCRSIEEGRSKAPRGTYTDTSQRERALALGVADDSGCSFVASNARRTYTFS